MKVHRFFSLIILLSVLLFSCTDNSSKAQTNTDDKKINIKPFTASILNSFYAEAYSVQTILTDKQLRIIFKSDLVGEKDTTVFSKDLEPSDTLRQISEINIKQLKNYYSNPCIEDGSQITVIFKKNGESKSAHLSNYYQEDIGKIIYLTNSLVPDKYKVWYDKEKLLADYKHCK